MINGLLRNLLIRYPIIIHLLTKLESSNDLMIALHLLLPIDDYYHFGFLAPKFRDSSNQENMRRGSSLYRPSYGHWTSRWGQLLGSPLGLVFPTQGGTPFGTRTGFLCESQFRLGLCFGWDRMTRNMQNNLRPQPKLRSLDDNRTQKKWEMEVSTQTEREYTGC